MKEAAGDLWTWTALDAETKLIPCRFVGQRDAGCAYHLIHDLKARLANRVQLTTDGHRAHLTTVEDAFGAEINYAMLQKIYGTTRSTTDQKSEIRGQTSAFPPSLYHPQPLPRARVREALRNAPLTYANYLDLEKLLTLQKARSTPAEHDEAPLIIRHKYELWFTILAPLINEVCSGVPKNVTINRVRESFLF